MKAERHRLLAEHLTSGKRVRRLTAEAGPFDSHNTLSAGEREVLQLDAEGKSSPEIAALLHISRRTVEIHRTILMNNLGLWDQLDLFRHAVKQGLILLNT